MPSKPKYPIIQPIHHPSYDTQCVRMGSCEWSISRLIAYAKDLPVFDLPLSHMDLSDECWASMVSREFAGHIIAVQNADLSKPIILSENGAIFDGRHRVVRAIIDKRETIKAVRFLENPSPCREDL